MEIQSQIVFDLHHAHVVDLVVGDLGQKSNGLSGSFGSLGSVA